MKKLNVFFICAFIGINISITAQSNTTNEGGIKDNSPRLSPRSLNKSGLIPGYTLDVENDQYIAKFGGPGTEAYIDFFTDDIWRGTIELRDNNNIHFGTSSFNTDGNLLLQTGGTTRMTIADDGNVGIGTTTPTVKLDVAGRVRINGNTDGPAWRLGVNGPTKLRGSVHIHPTDDSGVTNDVDMFVDFKRIYTGGEFASHTLQILPNTSGTTHLQYSGIGSFSQQWTYVYSDIGQFKSVTPNADNLHDIGSSFRRWDDIYATNGTIQTSDRRDKTAIKNLQYGLQEIMQLRPVTFQWKDSQHPSDKIGLIAQEVQGVVSEVVKTHDFQYNEQTKEMEWKENQRLGMYYSDLIPVLIKATQEQQQIIDNQQANNDKLETEIADLKQQVTQLTALVKRVASLENNLQSCCLKHQNNNNSNLEQAINIPQDRAQLQQNFPNPFHQQTEIQYYLPANTKTANLQISDLNGKVLTTYSLTGNGVGKVQLDGGQLAEGMYVYTLVVNGKLVDTKQMVLTK